MKKAVNILLYILLAIVGFIWLMFLRSGHNVPFDTHLFFIIAIAFLLFLLFLIWFGSSK
ncbi:MAG: hypothetical protein ACOH1O_02615 [Flavobacterium sp.]